MMCSLLDTWVDGIHITCCLYIITKLQYRIYMILSISHPQCQDLFGFSVYVVFAISMQCSALHDLLFFQTRVYPLSTYPVLLLSIPLSSLIDRSPDTVGHLLQMLPFSFSHYDFYNMCILWRCVTSSSFSFSLAVAKHRFV